MKSSPLHALYGPKFYLGLVGGMLSNISAEISRKRINSSIATFVLNHGGASIKYLEISAFHPTLILPDGVHLTNLGNFHYLTTLQNALKQFIQNGSNKFPSL